MAKFDELDGMDLAWEFVTRLKAYPRAVRAKCAAMAELRSAIGDAVPPPLPVRLVRVDAPKRAYVKSGKYRKVKPAEGIGKLPQGK
jgi:hypothetical protein